MARGGLHRRTPKCSNSRYLCATAFRSRTPYPRPGRSWPAMRQQIVDRTRSLCRHRHHPRDALRPPEQPVATAPPLTCGLSVFEPSTGSSCFLAESPPSLQLQDAHKVIAHDFQDWRPSATTPSVIKSGAPALYRPGTTPQTVTMDAQNQAAKTVTEVVAFPLNSDR